MSPNAFQANAVQTNAAQVSAAPAPLLGQFVKTFTQLARLLRNHEARIKALERR